MFSTLSSQAGWLEALKWKCFGEATHLEGHKFSEHLIGELVFGCPTFENLTKKICWDDFFLAQKAIFLLQLPYQSPKKTRRFCRFFIKNVLVITVIGLGYNGCNCWLPNQPWSQGCHRDPPPNPSPPHISQSQPPPPEGPKNFFPPWHFVWHTMHVPPPIYGLSGGLDNLRWGHLRGEW